MKQFEELINKAKSECSQILDGMFYNNIHFKVTENVFGSVVIVGRDDHILIKYECFNPEEKFTFIETLQANPDTHFYGVTKLFFTPDYFDPKRDEADNEKMFYKEANRLLDLAHAKNIS